MSTSRDAAEAYLNAQVDRIIAETADEWDADKRFRQLVTKFGVDDAQEFAHLLVHKGLNALERM